MEDAAVAEQVCVQFLGAQADIRARLAVKAEIPVAVGEGVDQGQRRGDLGVAVERARVDPGLPHRPLQHVAEAVPPHLADEGAALPQLAQHGQHVGRRAAGVGLKEGVALLAQSVLGKIDQQLAQRYDVEALRVHSSAPPQTVFT